MTTVGAYEAKTHLPKLLDRVARGERITITRHGVPVAVLQPPETRPANDPGRVIREIRAFRSEHRLGDLDLKGLIEQGRK